jgi:hypothetical protein
MMELAVALSAIAARAIVVELVRGGTYDRGAWADVAGQVVETVIATTASQESGIRQVGQKVDDIALREFDQHMAAGRRHLRDLPVEWRTEADRRDLIRDARGEFVSAAAIAERRKDLKRQVTAEVAIAGCWLWVPSLKDVTNTIGFALMLLENELLFGTGRVSSLYADVVKLARSYGAEPAHSGDPIADIRGHIRAARIGVYARDNQWVGCAGVDVRVDERHDWTSDVCAVTVTIRNTRADWIAAELISPAGPLVHDMAVIITLPTNDMLPGENRIAPGGIETLGLTVPPPAIPQPSRSGLAAAFGAYLGLEPTPPVARPPEATIGFLVPRGARKERIFLKSPARSQLPPHLPTD